MRILLDRKWHLDLPAASADAATLHGGLPRQRDEMLKELSAFFLERLRFLLEKKGHAPDVVQAVLTTDCPDLADAEERVEAVGAMRKEQDFLTLASAFKRMQNILAQAPEAPDEVGEPDLAKMTDAAEQTLALDYLQARGMLDDLVAHRRYGDALSIMASLGPALDHFFTEVHVMADDAEVKANRIALLRSMRDQFIRVARFSEIRG